MKPTTTAPAMKIINGKKCVRVLDLAHAWGSSTWTILATDKLYAVPHEYIHPINGHAWCELEGLRLRAEAAKNSSISREILAFLDRLEKPETATLKASNSMPLKTKPTDLGTAALIADARRTASQAAAKAENNEKRVETLEKRMDAAESVVRSAANIAEEASEAVDRIETTAQQAADLAKENADIVSGEIERLTRLSNTVGKVKKKAQARHDNVVARIMGAERKQRDNAARIQTLEEHARAIDWTLAAVAMLGVVGRLARLLRRR